jgi:hypothetical protein
MGLKAFHVELNADAVTRQHFPRPIGTESPPASGVKLDGEFRRETRS